MNPQRAVQADLKACNMCLGAEDGGWVAFCDFQYIGKACCAKDLAYLLVCGRGPLDLSAWLGREYPSQHICVASRGLWNQSS